jgi:hypothetical protein
MYWRLSSALPLLVGTLLVPPSSSAQQTDTTAAKPPQAATELVFEREVFTYSTLQRRNPFRALVGGNRVGPRYEQLRVVGIIYSDDPSLSVATLGTSTVEYGENAASVTVQPGVSWFLKVGQSIGNIRIVEIRREQVVVDVEQFGITEQKIMQLQTRRPGGTP